MKHDDTFYYICMNTAIWLLLVMVFIGMGASDVVIISMGVIWITNSNIMTRGDILRAINKKG